MEFHPKAQVCKSKLQSCPDPYKLGYLVHSANNIQMVDLITNVLEVKETENGYNIGIAVQLEAVFKMEAEIKIFYKNYNRHDKEEQYSLNHIKVPTVYCSPKYCNTIVLHLIRLGIHQYVTYSLIIWYVLKMVYSS